MATKKTRKSTKAEQLQPEPIEPQVEIAEAPEVEEPAEEILEAEVAENEAEASSAVESGAGSVSESEPEAEAQEEEDEPEFNPKPKPPAKLERLQKILAQAGIASRRKAEEMIEQGRVQVNGKVVTELGTKADAGRDHIRVDGKLLQGAERLRYFVLNKPKGFVTTVKDPEGRPTVMQFFEKMRERLYPVGRLDYMSEGLLVVTNDGELANRLTRAASGVEKTYLVKVAGQPTEAELDILRGGVTIERGKPGSGQVRTSPARIRQVRQGDNPWFEVVLIEGRNRELRKMFEEIGHFVEKIRRVGYGPLVLDQEPGNLRELQPEELDALRKAAEGKARTPKSKELRRRNAMDAAGLPTVAPRPTIHPRPAKPFAPKPFEKRAAAAGRPAEYRPAAGTAKFGTAKFGSAARPPFRREESEGSFTPRPARPAWKKDERPARPPARFAASAPSERRPGPSRPPSDRPRPERPFSDRPRTGGPSGAGRTGGGRTFGAKPAWNKAGAPSDRPAFKRPSAQRPDFHDRDEDLGPVRPPNLHIEEVQASDYPSSSRSRSSAPRPGSPRSYSDRPSSGRPGPGRPNLDRASSGRAGAPRSGAPRGGSDRPSGSRPFRSEGGLPRAFTTSSGKPRPGGARPSSKSGAPTGRSSPVGWKPGAPTGRSSPVGWKPGAPTGRSSPVGWKSGKPAGRTYGSGPGARTGSGPRSAPGSIDPRTGSGYRPAAGGKRSFDGPSGSGPRSPRPFTPRGEGTGGERKTGAGWKPKTRYGGTGKPAPSARSKPKPGSSAKPSHRVKPGAKRPGGKPGGKKRG
jgi:23S rRNA pseudouridine2605 synthase